jgi:outer membrane receptor protein involved in Fe transport
MSLFQKDVAGFVQSFASPETIDGVNYVITRPRNSGTGTIKGYELSYQQFFDFLPSFWSGLGVQAN